MKTDSLMLIYTSSAKYDKHSVRECWCTMFYNKENSLVVFRLWFKLKEILIFCLIMEKKLSYFLRGSRNALSLTLNKILCRIPCDSNYWRKSTWKPNRHKLLSHYYIVQIVFFVRYNLQWGNNREIKSRDVSRFLWNIYDEASCQKSHTIDIWCGRKHTSGNNVLTLFKVSKKDNKYTYQRT